MTDQPPLARDQPLSAAAPRQPGRLAAWGPEALRAGQGERDKPILLSVGYAACHWCHVMAHECFEDPAIAALMNKLFVNIKVDREERPDVDTIYQSALALLGQQGGWPLTMFLTPGGEPFWGGTYFPPEPRYGRPGFPRRAARGSPRLYRGQTATRSHRQERRRAARRPRQAVRRTGAASASRLAVLDQIARPPGPRGRPRPRRLRRSAPKFPQPAILKLLWRAWKRSGGEP